MHPRTRLLAAGAGTAALFVAVQIGALALIDPFADAGFQAVEDPTDPTNSLAYLGAVLVITAVMLGALKLGVERLLRVAVVGVSGFLSVYVFSVLVPPAVTYAGANLLAWALAGAVALALYVHPEWYVIDAAGVIIGAGGAGLFGISFGPLPAIVLLGALAVYDAVAVYRTEHMLTLAESVTDLKLPLVLVIPLTASYSFLDDGVETTDREGNDPGTEGEADREESDPELQREAFYVGLGDAVMPSIIVASAAFFSPAGALPAPGIALNLPALAAMVGTVVGLATLLYLVAKGRPQAGLPLLNGGAIGGYLLGSLAAGVPLAQAIGLAG